MLPEKNRCEKQGGKGFQIPADRNRRSGKFLNSRKIEKAAGTRIDNSEEQKQVPVLQRAGKIRKASEQSKNSNGQKTAQQLNSGVFQSCDVGRFFVENHHDGISRSGTDSAEDPKQRETGTQSYAIHQDHAAQYKDKAEDSDSRIFFPEQQGGQSHDKNRSAVVEKGSETDADLRVCFIETDPANPHSGSGTDDEQKVLRMTKTGKPPFRYHEKNQEQKNTADQCAPEDDFIAVERDVSGHDAVGTKQQKGRYVFIVLVSYSFLLFPDYKRIIKERF